MIQDVLEIVLLNMKLILLWIIIKKLSKDNKK